MSKEVIMKCPDCGAIVRGRYGLILNREFKCNNCSRKINPRNEAYETVTCRHCGNTVIRDTRIGSDQDCPACGYSLSDYNIADIELPCPSCHMNQRIKYNETMHTCPICSYTFDVSSLRAVKDASENSSATVVTVPAGNTDIIWKHPMTVFPFASHVVVPEGYSGLILRDGICSAPSEAGKYVLSDTIRTMTQQLEYSMLEKNAQISAQIFFVRKNIDKQMKWTGSKQPVSNPDGSLAGTLGFGGSISVSVVDAKKFAEFVGYDSVSADQLIVPSMDRPSKLYEKIRSICYETTELVLKSAVYSNGFAFEALGQNISFFKQKTQPDVDNRLADIGLKTSLFAIDFISFEEDEERKKQKATQAVQTEVSEQINRYIESLFEWESPVVHIHMKNDITLSADVKYGGNIKLRIKNADSFKNVSEVQHWIKNGVNEQEVRTYATELVKHAAGKVLVDILQQMINDTEADIRDMTIYFPFVRDNAQNALTAFFAPYGLEVDMFTMQEKERRESNALLTLDRAQEHKSVGNINMDVYSYDKQQYVDRSAVDNRSIVDIDNQKVATETAITRNNQSRAQNTIDNMYIQNNIDNAKDDIARQQQLKHESWSRDDAASQSEWQHSQRLKGYQYQSELSQAAHNVKVQDIRQSKDQQQEMHYMNQQEIQNRAEELRAQWEADTKQKINTLANDLRMENMRWENSKKMTREQSALDHEMEQAAAENDRLVNSIIRKIAESDLELSEKKEAFERMLRNQKADDDVNNMKNMESARTDLDYRTEHLKNILTKEENDLVEEMRNREAARAEAAKNADFVRDMKIKERDNSYELTLLKMEYERDKYKAEMEHRLNLKDKEIAELREKLGYNAHLSDNSVEKEAVRANAEKDTKTAEYGYKAAHDNMVYASEQKRYQDEMDIEKKYMDRLDEMLSQMLAIDAAVKKYSSDNEKEAINASANVQMVQSLANAQSNVAQADMLHTYAAQADTAKINETNAKISEMEEMMKKMKDNIKALKKAAEGIQENSKAQAAPVPGYRMGTPGYAAPGYGMNGYSSPYAGAYTVPSFGAPAGTYYSNVPKYQTNQPGTVRCRVCNAQLPAGSRRCPSCGSDQ